MYNVLQIINLILVIILGIAQVIGIITKPGRQKKKDREAAEKKEAKRKADQAETYRCILRNMITDKYYDNLEAKRIKQYEFEELAKVYENYKNLGGNSFIDKIWSEMQTWDIDY